MKEYPILFSGEMVQAILDGRKTQTRRVINPQPKATDATGGLIDTAVSPTDTWRLAGYEDTWGFKSTISNVSLSGSWRCPYGAPGDSLWVRESCQIYGHWVKNGHTKSGAQRWKFSIHASKQVLYAGGFVKSPSDKTQLGFYKRPSIFMPRWASRILLEVTDVRVERVQEISDGDAKAEGLVGWKSERSDEIHYGITAADVWETDPRITYKRLWDSINAERGHSWESNPWVWVVGFKVVKP